MRRRMRGAPHSEARQRHERRHSIRTIAAKVLYRYNTAITISIHRIHHRTMTRQTSKLKVKAEILRDCEEFSLLGSRDCEEFRLLGSPLAAAADGAGADAGEKDDSSMTKRGGRAAAAATAASVPVSPPKKKRVPKPRPLAPREHSQTALVPLYNQVQSLIKKGYHKQGLDCIMQALMGIYQHSVTTAGFYNHEEHLMNLRNSTAGLWCLLAHVWLEITHNLEAVTRLLGHIVAHCPLTGNHGWIATTLVRLQVLQDGAAASSQQHKSSSGSTKRSSLQTAKERCWDGMDRAHGLALPDERVELVEFHMDDFEAALPTQDDPAASHIHLSYAFERIMQLAGMLKIPAKSFFSFNDPPAAALLCQELNCIAAYEHRVSPQQQQPPPPQHAYLTSGVDAYPLFSNEYVYSEKTLRSPFEAALLEGKHERKGTAGGGDESAHAQTGGSSHCYTYVVYPPEHPSDTDQTTDDGDASREETHEWNGKAAESLHTDSSSHCSTSIVSPTEHPEIVKKKKTKKSEQKKKSPTSKKRRQDSSPPTPTKKKKKEEVPKPKTKASAKTTTKSTQKTSPATTTTKPPRPTAGKNQYWMEEDWEPLDEHGMLVAPQLIRERLSLYIAESKFNKTTILHKMNVNSNSYRKFMLTSRYKEPWRATENGTYWAAARLLEAAKNNAEDSFHNPFKFDNQRRMLALDHKKQQSGGSQSSNSPNKRRR